MKKMIFEDLLFSFSVHRAAARLHLSGGGWHFVPIDHIRLLL